MMRLNPKLPVMLCMAADSNPLPGETYILTELPIFYAFRSPPCVHLPEMEKTRESSMLLLSRYPTDLKPK